MVAYADCGTYGALDGALAARGIPRCAAIIATTSSAAPGGGGRRGREPGTYFLTDFLARSFDRTVWSGLGLDRHPELRDDYFGNYTRVVWLAQRRTPELRGRGRRGRGGWSCRWRCAMLETPDSSASSR